MQALLRRWNGLKFTLRLRRATISVLFASERNSVSTRTALPAQPPSVVIAFCNDVVAGLIGSAVSSAGESGGFSRDCSHSCHLFFCPTTWAVWIFLLPPAIVAWSKQLYPKWWTWHSFIFFFLFPDDFATSNSSRIHSTWRKSASAVRVFITFLLACSIAIAECINDFPPKTDSWEFQVSNKTKLAGFRRMLLTWNDSEFGCFFFFCYICEENSRIDAFAAH